jgi:hypothetical protein
MHFRDKKKGQESSTILPMQQSMPLPLYYRNSFRKWCKLNPLNLPKCRCNIIIRIGRKLLMQSTYATLCEKCFEIIYFQYDSMGYPTAAIVRRI